MTGRLLQHDGYYVTVTVRKEEIADRPYGVVVDEKLKRAGAELKRLIKQSQPPRSA